MPAGSKWSSRTLCLHGHVYTGSSTAKRTMADGTVKTYRVRRCSFCDNQRRRTGRGLYWRRLLACCPKGHPYSGENLGVVVVSLGGKEREYRRCKACRRVVAKRAMQTWRAKVAGRPRPGVGDTYPEGGGW